MRFRVKEYRALGTLDVESYHGIAKLRRIGIASGSLQRCQSYHDALIGSRVGILGDFVKLCFPGLDELFIGVVLQEGGVGRGAKFADYCRGCLWREFIQYERGKEGTVEVGHQGHPITNAELMQLAEEPYGGRPVEPGDNGIGILKGGYVGAEVRAIEWRILLLDYLSSTSREATDEAVHKAVSGSPVPGYQGGCLVAQFFGSVDTYRGANLEFCSASHNGPLVPLEDNSQRGRVGVNEGFPHLVHIG